MPIIARIRDIEKIKSTWSWIVASFFEEAQPKKKSLILEKKQSFNQVLKNVRTAKFATLLQFLFPTSGSPKYLLHIRILIMTKKNHERKINWRKPVQMAPSSLQNRNTRYLDLSSWNLPVINSGCAPRSLLPKEKRNTLKWKTSNSRRTFFLETFWRNYLIKITTVLQYNEMRFMKKSLKQASNFKKKCYSSRIIKYSKALGDVGTVVHRR